MSIQSPDAFAPTWKWWLPPHYSSYGGDVDALYYWVFWITMVTFVLTEGALVWFCFKYKKNPARQAVYTHGNHKLEVWWTIIPALVLVALGVFSANTWATIKYSKSPRYPKKFETEVRIRAQQFAWNVGYQGSDGKWDTNDDFEIKNVLNVPYEPVGPDGLVQREENVRILLTSQDVLHSFFVPVLRLKQDAVPGFVGNLWFDVQGRADDPSGPPTSPGPDGKYFTPDDEVYEVACAELCGLGHSTMRMELKALPRDVWEKWVAEQSAAAVKRASEAEAARRAAEQKPK